MGIRADCPLKHLRVIPGTYNRNFVWITFLVNSLISYIIIKIKMIDFNYINVTFTALMINAEFITSLFFSHNVKLQNTFTPGTCNVKGLLWKTWRSNSLFSGKCSSTLHNANLKQAICFIQNLDIPLSNVFSYKVQYKEYASFNDICNIHFCFLFLIFSLFIKIESFFPGNVWLMQSHLKKAIAFIMFFIE